MVEVPELPSVIDASVIEMPGGAACAAVTPAPRVSAVIVDVATATRNSTDRIRMNQTPSLSPQDWGRCFSFHRPFSRRGVGAELGGIAYLRTGSGRADQAGSG